MMQGNLRDSEDEVGPFGRGQFARAVVDALRDYHDPVHLKASSLTSWLVLRGVANESGPIALRELLRETIESLRPQASVPFGQREWLGYRVLWSLYIQSRGRQAICRELGLSQSTYYRVRREALDAGRIALLAAGTGNPFFTTDTAAALRALEIRADVLLKATKVDGVYDSDPKTNPEAKRFGSLSYEEAVARNLQVMDRTAFTLCRENALPVMVFDLLRPGNVARAFRGEPVGTLMREA